MTFTPWGVMPTRVSHAAMKGSRTGDVTSVVLSRTTSPTWTTRPRLEVVNAWTVTLGTAYYHRRLQLVSPFSWDTPVP